MSLSVEEVSTLKTAPATTGVLPIILERWSPHSFDSRPVPGADLESIFEAVRWTASSYNEQPWRFLVGLRGTETYEKIFSTLIPFNKSWAVHAPVLILGVTDTKFSHNGAENIYAIYDLGAASTTLKIEATFLGLSAHTMAGFDHAAARQTLKIPEQFALGAVIALGYQGEPDKLSDPKLQEQEIAPRQRKGIKEFVFSSWSEPASLK